MILVSDIIGEVEQVTGRCDQPYLFGVLTRAVETLARKACAISPTWDPLMIYVDLPTQQDFFVYLPYQIEKPIKININGNPTFAHSPLYEFTQNGPGSNDIEAGWQWQDRLTGPIQRRWPRGAFGISAISDSEADVELNLTVKVRGRSRTDYIITLPITPAGTNPVSSNPVYGVIEVVKPVTQGTVTLMAGPYILANYYPNITLPEFACIKLSQKAVAVRMLARRKTMPITSLLDVIPLNSSQAVVCQCQAIKYQDEVHLELAGPYEQQAITYLNEEQAARNTYGVAANEVVSALNLTIGQRDVVIVADIYDEAAAIFGLIGRQRVFDRITSTMELLFNKCQYWDGLCGVVTLRADQDYYVSLPRYVDTVLAMNINRTIGAYHSPWFEFSYAGLGEFGDLQNDASGWQPWPQLAQQQGSTNNWRYPYSSGYSTVTINGSNRLGKGWEEVGTTPLAFRLRGPAQLYAQPELAQDNGARITVFGYLNEVPVLNSRGQWGVDIPCYSGRYIPSTAIFDRVERVTKDPSYGFINLFAYNPYFDPSTPVLQNGDWCPPPGYPQQIPPACVTPGGPQNPYGQTDFVAMYWPWDVEPQYRLIRVGAMCKRVRLRYKKNWLKITQLTDPLHVRSREAIILAMAAVSTMRTGGTGQANTSQFMPTAPVQIAMDQLQLAGQLLDDEWSARNPHATITIQWPRSTYGNSFAQIM